MAIKYVLCYLRFTVSEKHPSKFARYYGNTIRVYTITIFPIATNRTVSVSWYQRKSWLAEPQLIRKLIRARFRLFQCFFCPNETEFDNLCQGIRQRLIHCRSTPLFELCRQRPAALRTTETDLESIKTTGFKFHSRDERSAPSDSRDAGGSPKSSDGSDDEDFEIL